MSRIFLRNGGGSQWKPLLFLKAGNTDDNAVLHPAAGLHDFFAARCAADRGPYFRLFGGQRRYGRDGHDLFLVRGQNGPRLLHLVFLHLAGNVLSRVLPLLERGIPGIAFKAAVVLGNAYAFARPAVMEGVDMLAVVPEGEKAHTGAAAREQPQDSPVIAR